MKIQKRIEEQLPRQEMMMSKLLGIVFFFLCLSIYPQSQVEKLKSRANSICSHKTNKLFCLAYKYYLQKEYDSCYIYVNKAKSLLIKRSKEENNILNYIQGVSAIKKRLLKKALNAITRISDDTYFKPLKEAKLGRIYLSLKEYNKAIIHYKEWEKINAYTKKENKINAYHNMGLSYIHIKEHKKAINYFNKELNLINKKDTLELISIKMDIANVYYNQYLDDKAIPLFKEAYNLAKKYSDLELKQNTAKNMAVVEKNRKNFKASVTYYKEYDRWKDSIWNRDKIWELTERDKQLAVAQKQQEIALQQEKIKRQKITQKGLIIGASGLLLFIVVLGYFYKKVADKNSLINKQKEALSNANKTKDYLFSVVSHDLRSPINTIRRQHEKLAGHIANEDLLSIKNTTSKVIAVTENTNHLLNNVLNWSLEQGNQFFFNKKQIPVTPLIQQVVYDYNNIAEAKSITITTQFAEDVFVTVDTESLKIVLRNLVDNAIKYTDDSGKIHITTSKKTKEQVRIQIADTGKGISKERLQKMNELKELSIDKIDRSKGVGLGLLLCQNLIKKNNGQLLFESEEGNGTTAIVSLPC